MNKMSRDRIASELRRAMRESTKPSEIWRTLEKAGVLAVLFPTLDRATIVKAGRVEHHFEGSVFNHTMSVLDRMNKLCEDEDMDDEQRERRLWMALAHDIGKVIHADRVGGIHSDDPPTGFPDHASIGADHMSEVGRRLGLSAEIIGVMQDACQKHMKFHDLPYMSPGELLDFLKNHQLDETYLQNRATAWELLDLAHADHEGRLKYDSDAGISRPSFDREPYIESINAVGEANDSVEGYKALETGLCVSHSGQDIDRTDGTFVESGESVSSVMERCEACRSPDSWVSDVMDSMRREIIMAECDCT